MQSHILAVSAEELKDKNGRDRQNSARIWVTDLCLFSANQYGRKQMKRKKNGKHFFATNRKVKDRLFRFIFENDKPALLDLYNGLNGTSYTNPDELEVVTVENLLYLSMKNDLSFLLTGTINLYEHQSSYNPNMPLRCLWYLGQEYQILVERAQKDIYGSALIQIPTPQCVVFYNGGKDMPDEHFLYLSDSFMQNEVEPCLELKVRMLNINYGHNQALMEKCRKLWEYAFFIDCIKRRLENGFALEEALEQAIDECVEEEVMAKFFRRHKAEVLGMLFMEYDEKEHMRRMTRDAKQEGREEGKEDYTKIVIRNMLNRGMSEEDICALAECTTEMIEEVRAEKQ